MNRRIRKKLHVDEYQEVGFSVKCKVRPEAGDPNYDNFWDEFIGEVERIELGY